MDDSRVMMTVDEYLALDRSTLDGRYEYIDGLVTMRQAVQITILEFVSILVVN